MDIDDARAGMAGIEAAQACWQESLTIFTELGAPQANDVRALLEDGSVDDSDGASAKSK